MARDKSQRVRLLDVFVLGPFMVAAGARSSTLPGWMRVGLAGSGLATIGYNLRNYIGHQDAERELPATAAALVRGVELELERGHDFEGAKRIAVEHLERDPCHYNDQTEPA